MSKEPCFLLYGANGWIGNQVYNMLVSMGIKVEKSKCRADNYDMVESEINLINGLTHVMSFIGRTHGVYEGEVISTIDYLEKPGKLVENINDNLYAPIILASICKKYGKHFTYLGTGCIFNYDDTHLFGDETTGFNEQDKPNFVGSSYSIVKGYTDKLMHNLYNDDALNTNEDYCKIKSIYKNKNSSQIIEALMIKTNTISADSMKEYKNGIYKIINHVEELSTSNYEVYNESTSNYLTVTSPIRRLIDILNIYKLCVNKNIFHFSNDAEQFYNNWINKLDYINTTSKNIRKVQSKCNILSVCLKNNHTIYKGNIFDKVILKNKCKYQVYIPELNVYSKIYSIEELDEKLEYTFKNNDSNVNY
jgi:hypothetical protein